MSKKSIKVEGFCSLKYLQSFGCDYNHARTIAVNARPDNYPDDECVRVEIKVLPDTRFMKAWKNLDPTIREDLSNWQQFRGDKSSFENFVKQIESVVENASKVLASVKKTIAQLDHPRRKK